MQRTTKIIHVLNQRLYLFIFSRVLLFFCNVCQIHRVSVGVFFFFTKHDLHALSLSLSLQKSIITQSAYHI